MAVFARQVLHQPRGRAIGNPLGQSVPPGFLLRRKVRSVKELLQADHLRPLPGRLGNQSHMLVDHGLFDSFDRGVTALAQLRLDERRTHSAFHEVSSSESPLGGGLTKFQAQSAGTRSVDHNDPSGLIGPQLCRPATLQTKIHSHAQCIVAGCMGNSCESALRLMHTSSDCPSCVRPGILRCGCPAGKAV